MSAFMLAAIIAAALALGVRFARAANVYAAEADVGLIVALLIGAVVVMGALSAAAVRIAARSRR
jgi:diketogulonate reductase-like aldo/keto reductase